MSKENVVVLTHEEWEFLQKMLDNPPPPPTEKLRELFAKHDKVLADETTERGGPSNAWDALGYALGFIAGCAAPIALFWCAAQVLTAVASR